MDDLGRWSVRDLVSPIFRSDEHPVTPHSEIGTSVPVTGPRIAVSTKTYDRPTKTILGTFPDFVPGIFAR